MILVSARFCLRGMLVSKPFFHAIIVVSSDEISNIVTNFKTGSIGAPSFHVFHFCVFLEGMNARARRSSVKPTFQSHHTGRSFVT